MTMTWPPLPSPPNPWEAYDLVRMGDEILGLTVVDASMGRPGTPWPIWPIACTRSGAEAPFKAGARAGSSHRQHRRA
jgi:hypothetical protein